MPTSIEQNLMLLLPAHAFLPPELVHLSTSLLAQSRSKAASLKPDEEIARTYACCNIACERLRHKLALDIAKTNPPTKPRVYAKLYTYLDGALNTTKSAETPQSQRRGWKDLKANSAKSAVSGNLGLKRPSGTVSTDATTPKHRREFGVAPPDAELQLPTWVMPLLNQLCNALDAVGAAIHVYAGAQSVMLHERRHAAGSAVDDTPSKRRRTSRHQASGTDDEVRLPFLLLAIYFHVMKRLFGEEITHRYGARRLKGLGVIHTYFKTQNASTLPVLPESQSDIINIVDAYVERCGDSWLEMEWYENIPSVTHDEHDAERDEKNHAGGNAGNDVQALETIHVRAAKTPLRRKEKHTSRPSSENDDVAAAGLLPALGTMVQPAIDWLSDERCDAFESWKQNVIRRCNIIEAGS